MATFEDAKAGWEIFRSADFALSRDELNARLAAQGFGPISERTFQHYRKLRRYGFHRYVPINQLDVKTLKDPLWDEAVRSRYPVYHVPVPVQIEATYMGQKVTIHGYAIEISPAMVTCRFDDNRAKELLEDRPFRKQMAAQKVTVHFTTTGQQYVARIEKITDHSIEGFVTVMMGFVSLAPIESVTNRTLLPARSLRVRFHPASQDALLSETVRRLYWLFQSLETSKVVFEELLYEWELDNQYALPSTRISKVSMQSPLHILLWVALPVAWVVGEALKIRKRYYEGNILREQARRKKINNDLLESMAQSLKTSFEEYTRRPIDPQVSTGAADRAPTLWRELVRNQLIQSIDELFDESTGAVEIDFGRDGGDRDCE